MRKALLLALLCSGCGEREAEKMPKTAPMPANTVMLSEMLQQVSADPRFVDRLLGAVGDQSQTGAAILSSRLLHDLRVAVLGRDWQRLDRFPGWTMREVNPAIDVVERTVPARPPQLDLGEYGLEDDGVADLDRPSTLPGFSSAGLVTDLGDDVTAGDGPAPSIAPMHSESARLAEVLNRLSLNEAGDPRRFRARLGGAVVDSPAGLMQALAASGHEVMVADARYFANFGHLHWKGEDVMMPFWLDVRVMVPGTKRPLLTPVSHAEYEWFVRGPKVNADVAFYFGIDGKAEFRTMDQLNQSWVLGRHAHEYRGGDAAEVTRLTGLLVLAYRHAQEAHPELPFGGYYALGVCQDGVAAIERKMTGAATLFPNTAEMRYFRDPRDAEINALLAAIPKDRDGRRPQMERVFGSLPTTDLAAISIPGLAEDLERVHQAWRAGTLDAQPRRWLWALGGTLALASLAAAWMLRRRPRR